MEPWKQNLYVLWGTQFFAMIGMNLVVPFLPFYIRDLGITDPAALAHWSGLVFAGVYFTSFLATPFWGTMGDKYGKKLMVVRAIFGLGVSQVFMGFAQNVYQLLLFRMVQGAISGFIASALALVSTSTPRERTGYALGLLQSATAGGIMIGPAIGGILADIIGYREIFFITAATCFIGGFIIIRLVHETTQSPGTAPPPSVLENYRFLLRDSNLRIVGITIVLSQAATLMVEPIFALFIESFKTNTKFIASLTGGTFTIAGIFMVISAPWWGKRNDRLGFHQNLRIALLGTGIAYALHIIVPNLFWLTILRAALGFAAGGILHALYSMVSLNVPEVRKSGMIGIASSLAVLGNMIGPLIGGMVAGQFGLSTTFAVNSAVYFLAALLIWKSYKS